MRIVGGEYGSRPLKAPKGMDTRPTLDQTREALFNILQGQIMGRSVLDLYAGSGAVALEALSRGADFATLCDMSRDAIRCINDNILSLGCTDRTRVMHIRDTQAIDTLHREGAGFDLIYLDPPYKMDLTDVMGAIDRYHLLNEGGILIAEHREGSMPLCPDGLMLYRTKAYRDTALSFYRRKNGTEDLPLSGQF